MGRAGAQGLKGDPLLYRASEAEFPRQPKRREWGGTGPLSLDSDLTKQRLKASPELTLSSCQHCPENLGQFSTLVIGWRLRPPFGAVASARDQQPCLSPHPSCQLTPVTCHPQKPAANAYFLSPHWAPRSPSPQLWMPLKEEGAS